MAASKMDPLLEIKNLKTHFFTHEGTVQAVNGVSLTVGRGRITGVVGESGCGKSVMGRSILNIIESNGKIVEGSILYYSEPGRPPVDLAKLHPRGREIRRIRGREISMIFQEPMTSFSPVHTVGNQIVPTADHPKNIEAFEWARSYVELYNRRPFVAGGFQSGGHAMTPGSSTQVAGFLDAGVQFTTGRVPHPPGGQNGTWGGGTAVVVPYNVPNPELSKRLARFFGEAEVQIERYWNGGVALPANWEALIKVGQSLPREYGPLLEQFPEARPRPPLWNEYYVSLLIPALNQVVSGSVTPQQALSNVQQIMKVRYAELFQ